MKPRCVIQDGFFKKPKHFVHKFDVDRSVHHQTIQTNLTLTGPCIIRQFKQINQPDTTVLQFHTWRFVSLNLFRAPTRPSSGA